MRCRRASGNRFRSEAASRWLEWLEMRRKGSCSGRCYLPLTRRPMNRMKNGRRKRRKKAACRNLRMESL